MSQKCIDVMLLCTVQRCLNRLKQSRERLISRFRGLDADSEAPLTTTTTTEDDTPLSGSADITRSPSVHEVMEEEWEKMRTEDSTLPQITPQRRKKATSLRARPECCEHRPPDNPAFSSDEEYEVQ